MKFLQSVLLILIASLATPVMAQDKSNTNMEILREKVKADKKLVVAANMALTETEAKGFWPVYEAYQTELKQINERMQKTILAYAEAYNTNSLTAAKAMQLTEETVAIEESEAKLRRSYLSKVLAVLPALKVARYFQIESKIRAALRYDLASQIPLVP